MFASNSTSFQKTNGSVPNRHKKERRLEKRGKEENESSGSCRCGYTSLWRGDTAKGGAQCSVRMAVIRMKARSWESALGIRKKIFGAGYLSAGFACSATLSSRESAPTATNPSISAMAIGEDS